MNNQFSIDFFISKFSAIPDERWTTGALFRFEDSTACAIGHCLPWGNSETWRAQNSEARALAMVLFGSDSDDSVGQITNINDGRLLDYQQPTPKARILAALMDAKAKAEAALDAYELRELKPISKPSTQPVEA